MITVTINGTSQGLDENSITYLSSNGSGTDIYTEVNRQEDLVNAEQSPSGIVGLSPILAALTNTRNSKVEITIGYSGSNIASIFTIGAGTYQALSDDGSTIVAIALTPANIYIDNPIKSSTGYGIVSTLSYSFPSNPLYVNLKRIKFAYPSLYGGSLINYDDSGSSPSQYNISLSVSTIETIINSTTLIWQISSVIYSAANHYDLVASRIIAVKYGSDLMDVYDNGVTGGWSFANNVVNFLDINGVPFNLDVTVQLQIIYA